MKRNIGIILLLALTNAVYAETAPEEAWNKTFGGDGGEARDIVHRAFTGLVDARGCRMRWIEGAGMVVERVMG